MPNIIRERQVGSYKVVIKQRAMGEHHYQTEYAILTYNEYGDRAFIPDDFGYGDSLDYINRKFTAVVETVEAYERSNSLEEMHRRVAKDTTAWNLRVAEVVNTER